MFPLLFIALALSAVALAVNVSPKARSWLDDHVHALQGAFAAHRAADEHLAAAQTTADPVIAVQHAHAATAANREAAQKTAAAAKTAQSPAQRAVVAQSAGTIVERDVEITGTLTDAHLEAAAAATDPIVAVQHVHEATEANRAAAQKAADAAKAAKTEQQRAAAAQSAAQVVDRENKIAAALAKLGVGQCGVHSYAHVTPQIKDALLTKLHGEGMIVTGDNPWDIDTHQYDVKLRAVWDPNTQVLKLIVTTWGMLASFAGCDAVWVKIDPILKGVIGA